MYKMKISFSIVLLSIVTIKLCDLTSAVQIDINNPLVSTRYGQVKGKQYEGTVNLPGNGFQKKNIVQFIGIPYARPPIGVNRFMPSVPPDTWTGVLDCTNNRVMCPQVEQRFKYTSTITEQEDCLHLNIYLPVSSNQFAQNLPVIVYFHGGEFKYGGKDLFRPDFLMEHSLSANDPGMIVVTVNYRLGVLGFLSTDDINQPGNNGIRDQTQALRWINENIGSFNGNPGNVTIFGHDAGAISVSMHILNQESWPYFSSAISVGGTVFTPWAFEDNPVQMAMNMGTFFKCDLKTDRLVDCLRYQDLGALMGKSRDRDWANNYLPYWFRPVVDRNVSSSAILKDFPLVLYQTGQYKKCPYVAGTTSKSGSLEYWLQADRMSGKPTIEEKIAFLIRPFIADYASEDILASAIKYQYFKRNQSRIVGQSGGFQSVNRAPITGSRFQSNAGMNNINSPYNQQQQGSQQYPAASNELYDIPEILTQMLSDFLYNAPTDYALRLHTAGGGQGWQFVFEHEGGRSFGPLQYNAATASLKQYGASQMDDIFYILPTEYSLDTSLGYDKNVANIYTSTLLVFVRRGMLGIGTNNNWQQYTANMANYFRFMQNGQTQLNTLYRSDWTDFWNDYIYDLQRKTAKPPTPFPYEEYRSYQAATWTMVAVVILLILILVALCAIFFMRKRKDKASLKLLRREDKELEERYNKH